MINPRTLRAKGVNKTQYINIMQDIKPTNLNYLFIDMITNFSHLVTIEPQTKQQFADYVKSVYSIENHKTALFYQSILKSDFDTIRLNNTRDSILFNQ